ncbi:MAG: hypothetical protein MPJ22_10495 [Pirellulales bacterium]|nr:hypothetical protein [Pirellulales bacterium]
MVFGKLFYTDFSRSRNRGGPKNSGGRGFQNGENPRRFSGGGAAGVVKAGMGGASKWWFSGDYSTPIFGQA